MLSKVAVASTRRSVRIWCVRSSGGALVRRLGQARSLSTGAAEQSAQGEEEKYGFKAETSKLLDIVTNSIYTEKEVFLRELMSNAADALEKFRHNLATNEEPLSEAGRKLEIRVFVDKEKGTLTIEDSGIGMTKQEMMDNLGTIARSGSQAFVKAAKEKGADAAKQVIGQFGVGFYSSFMVGDLVEVYSMPSTPGGVAHVWKSSGTSEFTIKPAPEFKGPGSRIVIHLKAGEKENYADAEKVRGIIKRYSNYVGFPIIVDGKQANEVAAIWTKDKSDVKEEEYDEFYKFCSGSFDKPLYKIHFKTDVPIDIKALLFIPSFHPEKLGMGHMKPGVSLYSRKVLLEHQSANLLPHWMRFVKGVVDSEDLPISISRETTQDRRLLEKIKGALTKRVLKALKDEAKKEPDEYNTKFAAEFGSFLKEAVCTDFPSQQDAAKLLRFNTSQIPGDKLTSLDEYISRCKPSQKKIYYMSAPSRELAERSPYFEVFKRNNIEVLFLYNSIDDFVMGNLKQYEGRELVAAESGEIDLDDAAADKDDAKDKDAPQLSSQDSQGLQEWLSKTLDDKLRKVTISTRLRDSPAIIVDHESASLRRMMKMVQQGQDGSAAADGLPKQHLEINPSHPIIVAVHNLRSTEPDLAEKIARQVYDNAVITAGLLDDARSVVPRLNKLLETLLASNYKQTQSPPTSH